jgi:hypothetical protein
MHGKSRFEDRALNWEDRLFRNVSRLDPSDERFPEISAKKFLTVLQGTPQAPSTWLDPREIETTKAYSIPSQPVVEPVEKLVPAPPPVAVAAPPPIQAPVQTPGQEPVLRNTPARQRQMIGGGEPKPPVPVLDPWASKQPLSPNDNLVKPGARIKFGS